MAQPGDIIRFNNTTGNHTVKSVDSIWPEGVDPVDISHQAVTGLLLSTPGIYRSL